MQNQCCGRALYQDARKPSQDKWGGAGMTQNGPVLSVTLHTEACRIKNHCVTSSSLILYLFGVLNSTQRYGCGEVKEI
eukprot:bmy_22140T0